MRTGLAITAAILLFLAVAEVAANLAGFSGRFTLNGVRYRDKLQPIDISWWKGEFNRDPSRKFNHLFRHSFAAESEFELEDRRFTVDKPEGTRRVLFLGDSGTFGSGVAVTDTFTRHLDARLRQEFPNRKFEVMNFGVPGFAPTESFELLRSRLVRLQPDHVFFVFFVANDIFENMWADFKEGWQNYFWYGPDVYILQHSALFNLLRTTVAHARYHFAKEEGAQKMHDYRVKLMRQYLNVDCRRYHLYERNLRPELVQGWRQLRWQFAQMNQLAKEKGFAFHVLLFPTHTTVGGEFQVYKGLGRKECEARQLIEYRADQFDANRPLENFTSICQTAGVHCLNSNAYVREKIGLRFFLGDDHASVEGHKALAGYLWLNRSSWLHP